MPSNNCLPSSRSCRPIITATNSIITSSQPSHNRPPATRPVDSHAPSMDAAPSLVRISASRYRHCQSSRPPNPVCIPPPGAPRDRRRMDMCTPERRPSTHGTASSGTPPPDLSESAARSPRRTWRTITVYNRQRMGAARSPCHTVTRLLSLD
ncbi:hypothetical protein L227DRAFT_87297 [Lentinus tigrinus ALCF2SS1-6]|uniref:Uncharacterized protein n=1 Tax=Lentinus tigrinus ALCF2SS1-6 TaxID=1328759 RepID=A0A5C2SCR7_9APHY|nr:hypothetical protein L227DRAFT_87297 [Lentinus tigrinus ALCF2SS1-6]